MKLWSLTFNVTPMPTSDSDSPPRLKYPTVFSLLSTSILTFLEAVEPYFQRHPYTNIRFRFPFRLTYPTIFSYHSTSILTFLKRWSLTSNVTPTPTSDSDSPPRVTHTRIFSRLSNPIFTHHEAVVPYLKRHPYTPNSMPFIR